MDGTLNTLPVENMTIKNVFQQTINEAETNQEGNQLWREAKQESLAYDVNGKENGIDLI